MEMLQGLSISHVKVGACDCWIGDPSGTSEVPYLCATWPVPTIFQVSSLLRFRVLHEVYKYGKKACEKAGFIFGQGVLEPGRTMHQWLLRVEHCPSKKAGFKFPESVSVNQSYTLRSCSICKVTVDASPWR